jgi:hypothetical protein
MVNKERLLSLLVPVQRGAETCVWLKEMVEAGEIFHPLCAGLHAEALQFLEVCSGSWKAAGVVVRMPAAWGGNRPPRPRITGTVGRQSSFSESGMNALLDFRMEITLDGEVLTAAEIRANCCRSPTDSRWCAGDGWKWISAHLEHHAGALCRSRSALTKDSGFNVRRRDALMLAAACRQLR